MEFILLLLGMAFRCVEKMSFYKSLNCLTYRRLNITLQGQLLPLLFNGFKGLFLFCGVTKPPPLLFLRQQNCIGIRMAVIEMRRLLRMPNSIQSRSREKIGDIYTQPVFQPQQPFPWELNWMKCLQAQQKQFSASINGHSCIGLHPFTPAGLPSPLNVFRSHVLTTFSS